MIGKKGKQLIKLLEKYRKNNGEHDCLVPGAVEKTVHLCPYFKIQIWNESVNCNMASILYTDYGKRNFDKWLEVGGFDNITVKPNPRVSKILTKLAILKLLHPFQTFILGQKNLALHIAQKLGINLVFFGENEAEYGNPLADNTKSLRDKSYFTIKNLNETFLAGVKIKELISKHNLNLTDLKYLPLQSNLFKENKLQIHYLGYYLKWIPQEAYYYSVENTGYKARPFRTEGI